MSELVTGEAVALELRPARLPSRALAELVDLAVALAVYVTSMVAVLASTSSLDDAAEAAIAVASFLLLLVGAPIAVETLSHGRSLGKLACGLRVVRDDGGPIRFRHALVRGAMGVVEILLSTGVIACVASLVSARGRRLGDVFAGTLVVRERVPGAPGGFVPPPPPWLAGRFSGLDMSAVPDGLWLAVRQYLTRMGQLDPQVSWSMAERLAADLAGRTGAPAPSDVPPAAYLAAVVHERQTRDVRRAFGGSDVPGHWSGGPSGGPGESGHPGGAWGSGGAAWWPAPAPAVPLAPTGAPAPPRAPNYADPVPAPAAAPSSAPAPFPAPKTETETSTGTGAEAGPEASGRPGTGFVPPA
ncbi:membrane protein [Streptomyces sulfonofaciens]|uniref:Membrane protein n=1 Tax=Streptomyces sulfonofaciens TaxID=68272 RepID=A0A919G7Y0_9ACTN|nr:RDD family protein [Streptomyces sulfonofaciens]GHH79772.1 membrane protein [Streptomyces sulfonofaciens]